MTGTEAQGPTAQLGTWSSSLRFEDVPADVVEHAKLCLLDALGCGLFGSQQPWGRITGDVAASLSPDGPATIWGNSRRVGPADAAMCNGTATHGFEIDDIHTRSLLHPGSVAVPAGLALAEVRGASGAALLSAIVAGFEVGLRVGICAGVPHSLQGFHPTGTVGCLAAAASAGNLVGLDPTGLTNALGIGGTQAAGLFSASRGAMAKRLHAGRAAQSGVLAALLAERGFTGCDEVLEASSGGFMSTMSPGADLTSLTAGLGQEWETLAIGFKAYAACASTHTTIDALDVLMQRGVTAERLARLRVAMTGVAANNVGWRYEPSGVVAAQMNVSYAAAVKLLDGDAFIEQYAEDRLADPRILELIERIEVVHDPVLDEGGAATRHSVRVEAEMVDGTVVGEGRDQRRGSSDRPLAADELVAKFRKTSAVALAPNTVEELIDLCLHVEELDDVAKLTTLLSAAGSTGA